MVLRPGVGSPEPFVFENSFPPVDGTLPGDGAGIFPDRGLGGGNVVVPAAGRLGDVVPAAASPVDRAHSRLDLRSGIGAGMVAKLSRAAIRAFPALVATVALGVDLVAPGDPFLFLAAPDPAARRPLAGRFPVVPDGPPVLRPVPVDPVPDHVPVFFLLSADFPGVRAHLGRLCPPLASGNETVEGGFPGAGLRPVGGGLPGTPSEREGIRSGIHARARRRPGRGRRFSPHQPRPRPGSEDITLFR